MKNSLKLFTTLVFLISGPSALSEGLTSSSEVGLMVSWYKYTEPSYMNIRVTNIGADYVGTFAIDSYWFMRWDIMGSISVNPRYSSNRTGSMTEKINWYLDTRALFGRSFELESGALAPYAGLGYRYLYNDGRGTTSTGRHKGYRRESNYLYVPIGVIHELDLTELSKLITSIEFDYFLLGEQRSFLSDVDSRNSDFIHWQRFGCGARFNLKYHFNNWAIGPYFIYWYLKDSDKVMAYDETGQWFPSLEPKNNTVEAGIKVSYRF